MHHWITVGAGADI